MAQNNTGGFVPITIADIDGSDPSLGRLNNQLQRLWADVSSASSSSSSTSSSSSSSSSWTDYAPTPTINGLGMTLSSFSTFLAKTLNDGSKVFVNLDLECTIGGSLGPALLISLPSAVPAQNQFGNVMSCILYPGSSTPVAGMARLTAIGSSAGIAVYRADGANFTAAATEIVVSGWYQI